MLEFAPGVAAQVDFGKGPEIVDVQTGESFKTWVFVMLLAWSRHQYAELVRDQSIETWLGCHRRAFEHFNGVPSKVTIDNPKCAITKACYHDPQVRRSYADYAEGYAAPSAQCHGSAGLTRPGAFAPAPDGSDTSQTSCWPCRSPRKICDDTAIDQKV